MLIRDWRRVLRRAWSIRLILVAGAFQALEFGLPFFVDWMPRGPFLVFGLLTTAGAFVTRILAQSSMPADEHRA